MNWLKGGLTGIAVSIVVIFLHILTLGRFGAGYPIDIAAMEIIAGVLV